MKTNHKSPALAFVLSFILPGLGLIYLRKWLGGLINISAVLIVGYAASWVLTSPNLFLAVLVGVGSGAWAYLQALEIGVKDTNRPHPSAPDPKRSLNRGSATIRRQERKEVLVGALFVGIIVSLLAITAWQHYKQYRHAKQQKQQAPQLFEPLSSFGKTANHGSQPTLDPGRATEPK